MKFFAEACAANITGQRQDAVAGPYRLREERRGAHKAKGGGIRWCDLCREETCGCAVACFLLICAEL